MRRYLNPGNGGFVGNRKCGGKKKTSVQDRKI